jgi:hypothetical protein
LAHRPESPDFAQALPADGLMNPHSLFTGRRRSRQQIRLRAGRAEDRPNLGRRFCADGRYKSFIVWCSILSEAEDRCAAGFELAYDRCGS